jgi:hypothetical protein
MMMMMMMMISFLYLVVLDVSWKSAIAVATLTFNDSTLVVLLLVFVVALFSSSPPPSILAILEHALRTFVRKPEPSFPTTKTVG